MLKKKNVVSLVMVTLLVTGVSLFEVNTLQAQDEEDCGTCIKYQKKRREHIRGCLSLWGNFSNGEAGGFLATGSKKVCRRDPHNTCEDNWLTGCVSSFK